MRKYLFLFCMALLASEARENPFKPIIDNTVLPVTSNKVEKAPPFEKTRVQLPVDARILTSVAIYYQSIDGSIKKEIVAIDRSIDWHKPLIISQEEVTPATHKKIRTPPRREKRKAAAEPKQSTAAGHAEAAIKYAPLPFVSLKIEKNRIKILTKDEKIRAFHLTHPFKVAIDFRRKAGFLTKHKDLDTPPFTAVDIGNHEGYYRVVVTFDAPYRYDIQKADDGYLLEVR